MLRLFSAASFAYCSYVLGKDAMKKETSLDNRLSSGLASGLCGLAAVSILSR